MKTIKSKLPVLYKKYEIKPYKKVVEKDYKPLHIELNNKDENHL